MVIDLFGNILDWTGIFLHLAFVKLRSTLIRGFILIGTLATILWLSVFLYASFYWLYMPSASHIRPVHFAFNVCPEGVGMCSFPQANVTFGNDGRKEILHKGQAYRIYVELELPESPENSGIGMFMIVLQMYDKFGLITQESARSGILHYRSSLLQTIYTLVFAPFYLAGLEEQKQHVDVELFAHYVDDLVSPSVGAIVQVQNRKINIYSSKLKIFADFTGLRYYLFYWPKLSAICGITSNFMFLAFVALLSWYQYLQKNSPEEEEAFVPMMRRMSLDVRRQRIREQLERERGIDSSSPEDDEETSVYTVGMTHDQGSHDIQETSLGDLAADSGDPEVVTLSSDVTLLPGSDNDETRLRFRAPSNINMDS